MQGKCAIHDVTWKTMERKLDDQCRILTDIRKSLEGKMPIRTFWTTLILLVTVLVACVGGLYTQGRATYEKVSTVETRVAVIETKLEMMVQNGK